MPKQTNIFVPAEFNNSAVTIVNADGTNIKELFTAGINGSDVRGVAVTSSDTSSRIVQLWQTVNSVDYLIGSVSIPALSGFDGSAISVNLLNPTSMPFLKLDNAGNKVLSLFSGSKLKVNSTTSVTSGKIITAVCYGVDY